MIRVLIADDHDLVRTGLSRMLSDMDGIENRRQRRAVAKKR